MVNKRQKSLWVFQNLASQQQKDSSWCLHCGENPAEKGYLMQQVWQHMWAGQLQVCGGDAWFPLTHENICWGVWTIIRWRQEKWPDKGPKVESRLIVSAYCSAPWKPGLYCDSLLHSLSFKHSLKLIWWQKYLMTVTGTSLYACK